jgi:TRAP-type mannitol/chloroaromatic compound transport system permease small subunit
MIFSRPPMPESSPLNSSSAAVIWLERLVDAVDAAAMWLVLPLSLLLFLQWPLRDLVHAYSREANDAAQILFALYVSVAITAATRARTHLAADVLAHWLPAVWRMHLERAGAMLVLLPWAVYLIWSGTPMAWRALIALESFGETLTPGYYLIKLALILLALLVALQALLVGLRSAAAR